MATALPAAHPVLTQAHKAVLPFGTLGLEMGSVPGLGPGEPAEPSSGGQGTQPVLGLGFEHCDDGAQEQEALEKPGIAPAQDLSECLKCAKAVAAELVAQGELQLPAFQVKHNKL